MSEVRPKLWVFASPGEPTDRLTAALTGAFEVGTSLPAPVADTPGRDAVWLVVGAADLRRLTAPPGAAGALLESLGQGACLVGSAGEVRWANTKFATYEPTTRARVIQECEGALAGFRRSEASPTLRRVDLEGVEGGKSLELVMAPANERQGKTDAVAALIHDVTVERGLRRKMDAIDAAGSQLVRFEADLVRKMNVFERLRLLETRIVQACRDLLKFDHFNIRLIDERTGKLEMVMHSGLPQESVELEIYPRETGNGISGLVAATGRSYICPDTAADTRFLPGFSGARSSLTVPLRMHDKVVGIFNVESERPGAFTEDDRQFSEIFGRYVAISLHMLNLLVVERSAVNTAVGDRVAGEISEPLKDILQEAEWFKELAARDPQARAHLERIRADVESIRSRVSNVATGAQTLLGIEGELANRRIDPALRGKRVLVADDEANIRRIIHDVLHNRGCEVTMFESGVGAIAALEAIAGGGPTFDAVLSDIRMPDRNGYEVFAAARKTLPGVPVILMTGFGYDPHHSIVRASQEGLQAVLFKPFPVDRLLEEVRKAVASKAG
ncbi:MAG: response regulator [Phycisphaerales bacterium]